MFVVWFLVQSRFSFEKMLIIYCACWPIIDKEVFTAMFETLIVGLTVLDKNIRRPKKWIIRHLKKLS